MISKFDNVLENKTFLLEMKKNHILEACFSRRENLLNSAIQAMGSTFQESEDDAMDSINRKQLGKSLKELDGIAQKIEDYSKEIKNDKLVTKIGKYREGF